MIGAVRIQTKPNEAAAYIEQASQQLKELATRAGLPLLAYLLDMARLEAAQQAAAPERAAAVPSGEP